MDYECEAETREQGMVPYTVIYAEIFVGIQSTLSIILLGYSRIIRTDEWPDTGSVGWDFPNAGQNLVLASLNKQF